MAISISSSPSVLVEEERTLLMLTISSDEPIPEGGLELTVSSELENALGQFDVFAAQFDNVQLVGVNDDTSGFRILLIEETGTITLPPFDDQDADSPLDLTFSVEPGEGYTVDENAGSVTLTIEDAEGGMATPEPEPEPPTTSEPPAPEGLQVSLFTGPDYLIEDEGTVSAHAFLATNGVIPEGGLVVSVDAPNLSEFDLTGVSVEGGEIAAVRDGGFDLLMTEYTTLVNLPIADDGEAEAGETASFSLAAGDGYEIIEEYSSGTFNLVDTREDIPRGVVTEPNDIVGVAVDTEITLENPSFSASSSIYFDPGNRYRNPDGTYTYIDANEDVDLYQMELSAGDTIANETFEVEGNTPDSEGMLTGVAIFDAEGNRLSSMLEFTAAAPDKLFGGAGPFNEDGTVNENETDTYQEYTVLEDGIYYAGVSVIFSAPPRLFGREDLAYDIEVPGSGDDPPFFWYGNYELEIDLLTEDNPRKIGTPTPPVSNPDVTNPPTLSLSASPITTDGEGNITSAVVEHLEEFDNSISSVTFTIEAEGEIPEEGIEFVLNSDANLFDYISFLQQDRLPSTIGGQSLGAFYNEDGIPTGIRLLIEKPIMTVSLESANSEDFLDPETTIRGVTAEPVAEQFEGLETDGAEAVNFFLQPGEGYEIDSNAGETEVTYYDSLADVPPPTGGDMVPEVGVTVSESTLIESEGTETTLTFTLSEPPPAEGVSVLLDSDDEPSVGSVLSQFDVLNAEISGGNFPIANGDESGFLFNITEQTATITLAAFDELSVDTVLPAETFQEGTVDLTFALESQPGYTIDPNASEVSLSVLDNPDSQIRVLPTAATVDNADSTALIESEGTVGVLNLSLGSRPTAEGLTVSVSTDALADFDTEAIEVAGGTLAAVRDDGFDITLIEREATVNLPVLSDGLDEGSETATFILEPSDDYEISQSLSEVTFQLADNLGQGFSEEIEGNDVLSEANVLGLSAENPTVSVSGALAASASEFPDSLLGFHEDVDLYSVTLDAGQTLALDIDAGEPQTYEAFVFPALRGTLQTIDTELRLFDADGNELAANNDGAAPDEAFSRDPYLEFTADSAGTYYLGVSGLGNRNYDPNVARSGSAWTFPEVGVFFGEYELTASLVDDTPPPPTPTTEPIFGSLEEDIIEVSGTSQLIFGGDSDDLIDASISSTGNNRIYAGSGDDTLILGNGDRLVGGEGADKFFALSGGDNILTGGAGADQFWIATAETPDSANIITDFTTGEDVLGIAGLGIGFDDLSITQQEDNTLIAANGSDLAILQGIGADSLIADNFAFA